MKNQPLTLFIIIIVGVLAFLTLSVNAVSLGYFFIGKNGWQEAGNLGSYLAGTVGLLIGLASAALVYIALNEQTKANKLLEGETKVREFEQVFFKFVEYHRENIKRDTSSSSAFKIREYIFEAHQKWDEIMSEEGLSLDEKYLLDISYKTVYYGISDSALERFILSINYLNSHVGGESRLKDLVDVFRENSKRRVIKDGKEVLKYKYNGYQYLLPHYFRNLFQALRFLRQTVDRGIITKEASKIYGGFLRAQISQQELPIIYYNCVSTHGNRFINDEGFNYLKEYEVLKNISPYLDTKINRDGFYHYTGLLESDIDKLVGEPNPDPPKPV